MQKQILVNLLSAKQLNVIESEQADYVLTVQQFSNEKVSDKKLLLKKSKGEKPNTLNIQNLQHSIFCADNEVNISLRLNHKQSADVIWIAQASITSHSYANEPVIYKLTQQQKISNEHVVLDFVQRQNTETARQKRFNKPVSVPEYQVESVTSPVEKVSGVCSSAEVLPLIQDMESYLLEQLIGKLNVS